MAPESPSLLLQRAAERIEQLAAAATPGPWEAEPDGCIVRPSALPHGTVHVIAAEVHSFNVVMSQPDEDWLTTMNPLVAAPLVAWLRDTAADLEVGPAMTSQEDAALDFARLILGVSAEGSERSDPGDQPTSVGISVEEETTGE